MWRRLVAMSLLFLIVCASVARSETKTENAGITGLVLVTPSRPGPVKKGSEFPKTAPLPHATFAVTSDSGAVTRFTTDAMGRFKISLKPGHYAVSLADTRFPKPCGPFEINVETGKVTDVEW